MCFVILYQTQVSSIVLLCFGYRPVPKVLKLSLKCLCVCVSAACMRLGGRESGHAGVRACLRACLRACCTFEAPDSRSHDICDAFEAPKNLIPRYLRYLRKVHPPDPTILAVFSKFESSHDVCGSRPPTGLSRTEASERLFHVLNLYDYTWYPSNHIIMRAFLGLVTS